MKMNLFFITVISTFLSINSFSQTLFKEVLPLEVQNIIDQTSQKLFFPNTYKNTSGHLDSTYCYAYSPVPDEWHLSVRNLYNYRASGEIEDLLIQSWDLIYQSWRNNFLFNYHYNENEVLTDLQVLIWNRNTQEWVDYYTLQYFYDNNDRPVKEIATFIDSGWTEEKKSELVYNDEGNVTEIHQFYWNPWSEDWYISNKFIFTYTSFGAYETILERLFFLNEWSNLYLTTYSYDELQRVEEELGEFWNGSIWKTDERNRYVYALNGSWREKLTEDWTGTKWELTDKAISHFDIMGLEESELLQRKQALSFDWQTAVKNERIYDDNGNLISTISKSWNESLEQLVNSSRTINDYNLQNQLLESKEQFWSQNLEIWNNFSRVLFEYNDSLLKEKETRQYYSNGAWKNATLSLFEYNPFNQLTYQTQFSWQDADWEKDSQTQFQYNEENLLSEKIEYSWNEVIGNWIPQKQTLYNYDDDHLLIEEMQSLWNPNYQSWEEHLRILSSYSGDGNILEKINQLYSEALGWNNENRWLFFYDSNGRLVDEYVQEAPGSLDQWDHAWRYLYNYNDSLQMKIRTPLRWHLGNHWGLLTETGPRTIYVNDLDGREIEKALQEGIITERGLLNQSECIYHWDILDFEEVIFKTEEVGCTLQNPYPLGSAINCEILLEKEMNRAVLYDFSGRICWERKISGASFSIDEFISSGIYELVLFGNNTPLYNHRISILSK